MDTTPLGVFVRKVTARNRILFADLRRLRRDVLPDGPTSREEIETLRALDSIGQVDQDWPEYLLETVVRFVLARSDPPGSVDADTAAWLIQALSGAKPKSAAAIVRALRQEVQQVDDSLLTYGRRAKRLGLGPQPGAAGGAAGDPRCEHPGPAGRRARLEVEGLGG